MRCFYLIIALSFASVLQSQSSSNKDIPPSKNKIEKANLKGTLSLPGHRVPTGVIIILKPSNKQQQPQPKAKVLNIVDKKIVPAFAVVAQDQQLFICNPSKTNHNIYSPGPLYPFDMGVLKKESPEAKVLPFHKHPFKLGHVQIYCSFYEKTIASLWIVPPHHTGTMVKKDGSFEIKDLPPGFYTLSTQQKNPRYQDIKHLTVELPLDKRLQLSLHQSSLYRTLEPLK